MYWLVALLRRWLYYVRGELGHLDPLGRMIKARFILCGMVDLKLWHDCRVHDLSHVCHMHT